MWGCVLGARGGGGDQDEVRRQRGARCNCRHGTVLVYSNECLVGYILRGIRITNLVTYARIVWGTGIPNLAILVRVDTRLHPEFVLNILLNTHFGLFLFFGLELDLCPVGSVLLW